MGPPNVSGEVNQRKRKGHKKSRLGCRNCKLRRVKCDETRPRCKQCNDFRVACNFSAGGSDLQASHDTVTDLGTPTTQICSANQIAVGMIDNSLSSGALGYHFDTNDLERLHRFQMRTVPTMGTAKTVHLYQKELSRLACVHPYVMHAVLTLVAKHDRTLSGTPYGKSTTFETFHESQAVMLFNQRLSSPLRNYECDAVGAVGVLLGTISIASIEASTPEEAWPLKPSSPEDLQWLRLSEGKKVLWRIVDPFRPESCFRSIMGEFEEKSCTTDQTELSIAKLPHQLLELCGLSVVSSPGENPYYNAVRILAALRDKEVNHSNIMKFLSFVNDIKQEFKRLLERKDPRALLLMALWYATLCHYHWWISNRARMECQAICIYLERYHANETAIQDLLIFAKMRCGLNAPQDLDVNGGELPTMLSSPPSSVENCEDVSLAPILTPNWAPNIAWAMPRRRITIKQQ